MSPPIRIPTMAQPTATPARIWGSVFAGAGSDATPVVGDAVETLSRPGDGDCPASVDGAAADVPGTMKNVELAMLPLTVGDEV